MSSERNRFSVQNNEPVPKLPCIVRTTHENKLRNQRNHLHLQALSSTWQSIPWVYFSQGSFQNIPPVIPEKCVTEARNHAWSNAGTVCWFGIHEIHRSVGWRQIIGLSVAVDDILVFDIFLSFCVLQLVILPVWGSNEKTEPVGARLMVVQSKAETDLMNTPRIFWDSKLQRHGCWFLQRPDV